MDVMVSGKSVVIAVKRERTVETALFAGYLIEFTAVNYSPVNFQINPAHCSVLNQPFNFSFGSPFFAEKFLPKLVAKSIIVTQSF